MASLYTDRKEWFYSESHHKLIALIEETRKGQYLVMMKGPTLVIFKGLDFIVAMINSQWFANG